MKLTNGVFWEAPCCGRPVRYLFPEFCYQCHWCAGLTWTYRRESLEAKVARLRRKAAEAKDRRPIRRLRRSLRLARAEAELAQRIANLPWILERRIAINARKRHTGWLKACRAAGLEPVNRPYPKKEIGQVKRWDRTILFA